MCVCVCVIMQASLPLFACNLQFFAKFGTFLCLTILFSWLFSNFCFMGVLATIGPAKQKPAKIPTIDSAKPHAPESSPAV